MSIHMINGYGKYTFPFFPYKQVEQACNLLKSMIECHFDKQVLYFKIEASMILVVLCFYYISYMFGLRIWKG